MEKVTIRWIEDLLRKEGYEIQVEEEQLILFIEGEKEDKRVAVTISLIEQILPDTLRPLSLLTLKRGYLFPVVDTAASEMGRFIAYINKSIDIPGFEYDEVEGTLQYRYCFLTGVEELLATLRSLLGYISLITQIFAKDIESVARGEGSMNEILQKAIDHFQKAKK